MLYYKQQLLFDWQQDTQVGFNLHFYLHLVYFQKEFEAHQVPFPMAGPSFGLGQV